MTRAEMDALRTLLMVVSRASSPLRLYSLAWLMIKTASAAVRALTVSWSRLGAQSMRTRS